MSSFNIISPSSSPAHLNDSMSGFRDLFNLLFISKSQEAQILRIDTSVLLTSVFLLLLFVYGSVRRRIRTSWLIPVMKGIYILTPLSITYTMGLMRDASAPNRYLFPVWAYFLVYAYGGVNTMTAFDLTNTNEQALQYTLQTTPLFYWATSIYSGDTTTQPFSLLFIGTILSFLSISNTRSTLRALYMSSKSIGLAEAMEPLVTYMREGKDVPNEDEADPVSMTGYMYPVWDNTITTEDIWQSRCTLLQSDTTRSARRSEGLKDLCLSYALYRLLLRRFAGFPLHESSKLKTSKFVEIGLLTDDSEQGMERVFRIIEVELDFLFEFFYTKLSVLGTKKRFYRFIRIGAACCLFLVFLPLHPGTSGIKVHGHGVEVGVTRLAISILVILEIWQISMQMLSNWKIVQLLCEYVKDPVSRKGKSKGKKIERIWSIKDHFSKLKCVRFFIKPWQRNLGQYSFMHSYCQVPRMRYPIKLMSKILNDLLKVPRIGQTRDFSIKLSREVKQAIISSLRYNGLLLSPGTSTLRRYEVFDNFSYACLLETDAHVILVWHIATNACEFFSRSEYKGDKDFKTATQLSNYCAYLLNFAPELLPDHPYATECIFNQAVKDALVRFKGLRKDSHRYRKMKTMTEEDESSIVVKGAVLANKLMDEVIGKPSKGWKVLAEFWAELLLYMSPSDNIEKTSAHGQHLAQGGEFITHLWALLTHAGVVSRPNTDSFRATI